MNQPNQPMAKKQQADTVRSALEKMKPQLAMALPRHLTPDRLLRVTMTAVQQNPKLLDCDRTSLFAAVMTCAQLGLEPDGVLGQAYLVPRKGKVQFIPGYKGYITLSRNSGEISSIQAHEVRRGDQFSYAYGLDEHLHHIPAEDNEDAPITHFYAYGKFKDGGHVFEVMSRSKVDRIRDNSDGYKAFKAGQIKSNPWDSDYVEMGRKTAIRRIAKYLPMSVQRAAALDAAYEGGKHATTDEYGDVVIDGESHEVETGQETKGSGATSRLDAIAGGGQSQGEPGGQQDDPGAGNGQQQATPTHDIDGVPWDERIHSVNRTMTDEGRWRRKRGISDDYYKQVVAEITAQGDGGPQEPPPAAQPQDPPIGPDPDDPITRVTQRMEEATDRDTLDEIADEALNGTDLQEQDRERITAAYKRNIERLAAATGGGSAGGKPLFGDEG